jgi:hypothetical protein
LKTNSEGQDKLIKKASSEE